jgi:hypothetical protein
VKQEATISNSELEFSVVIIHDIRDVQRCISNHNSPTEAPGSITYSSIVSRDSIRLAFLIAGLNDLDVLAGDVTNAY